MHELDCPRCGRRPLDEFTFGGEQMAELIAAGRTPDLIAPFTLERFRRDHALADQASAGTR